jgi:hypothetical protein
MTFDTGRSPELAFAAYGVARRITGAEEHAIASLEAAAVRPPEPAAAFLWAVREEARRRRVRPHDTATAPRPSWLAQVSLPDWAVLERVALRGMLVSEAAEAVGIDRRETLQRLQRGLVAVRDCLAERQPGDDAQSTRHDVLGLDLSTRGLDDAASDRQAQPAAAGGAGL